MAPRMHTDTQWPQLMQKSSAPFSTSRETVLAHADDAGRAGLRAQAVPVAVLLVHADQAHVRILQEIVTQVLSLHLHTFSLVWPKKQVDTFLSGRYPQDTIGGSEAVMTETCGLKRCLGREYYCAVELALQVIGGKWKPIILYLPRPGRHAAVQRAQAQHCPT